MRALRRLDLLVRATSVHPRASCRWRGSLSSVSESRLEEFVKAEQHYFAEQRFHQALEPLTFPQLVSQSSSTEALEDLLKRELPIRFAARISHIKKIPQWEQIPELVELHKMHATSFRELRLAEVRGHVNLPEDVQRIRQRHKRIVPLVADAVSTLQRTRPDISRAQASASTATVTRSPYTRYEDGTGPTDIEALDRWAEAVMASRISTEVMMTHYMAVCEQNGILDTSCDPQRLGIEDSTKIGILDKSCDPYEVCLEAAEKTSKLASGTDVACVINVKEPRKAIQLCHTPRYLFYVVSELLANSVDATLRHQDVESRPINITVCADDHDIVIRITDQGGGYPSGNAENIFSYCRGISESSQRVHGNRSGLSSLEDEEAVLKPMAVEFSPLEGRGIGLPMCRMYVRYLGGSLEAMNMPGEGVDTYIMLKRIDLL